jgi:HK97 family phage prohead protease
MKRAMKRNQPRMRPDGFEPGTVGLRFAQWQPSTYDATARTVVAVLSTGARRKWFGIAEELLIAPEAIDLTRVAMGQVSFLDSHRQDSVDAVFGSVVEAWIANGALYARIRFADTEQGRKAEGLIARGEVKGISVGYRVLTWTMIGVENDIEIWQAQRWELLEASLVAVPADPHAGVRSDAANRANAHTQEQDDMRRNAAAGAQPANTQAQPGATAPAAEPTRSQQQLSAPALPGAPAAPGATQLADNLAGMRGQAPNADAVRSALATLTSAFGPAQEAAPWLRFLSENPAPAPADAAIRAERERVFAIGDLGRRAGFAQADIDTAVRDGTSAEAFRTRAFDAIVARGNTAPTNPATPANANQDETETRRRGMADAIVARLERATARPGQQVQIPEHARAYGEMGFAEMAAEVIGHRGALRTGRQVTDVIERAFHSTSDFPAIFIDAINRRLLARYQAATPTYRLFCAPYMATDFRPTHVVRAGDFPALQPVTETGEIKAGTFSESKEMFRVYPYGVKFNLSRQMIINDQMGAIDQMLGSFGVRVTDWENALAFAKLNLSSGIGPVLSDGKAVFHNDHGNNKGTGGGVPDITTVGVGRAAMMKQKSLDGILLNLAPASILTGPDNLGAAEQLVASISPALIANAQPEWVKRLTPAGDANITGNGWYLFADPSVAPCFVYGYLEGFEGPRLKSEEQFGTQGLAVSLEHDFGVDGIDYRGGYRNVGQ